MKKYLFADRDLVETSREMTLRVNPPVRTEAVITREHSWERILMGLYLTAIDDNGIIKIWYGSRSSKENDGKHTAYAESVDGVTFEKKGIVIPETMEGTTYVDPTEVPEKRFGYFGNLWGDGLYRWTSPDGLQFTRDDQPLLVFESDTQNVMMWNDAPGTYEAYVRAWDIGNTKNDRRRSVMRLTHNRADSPWPYTSTDQPGRKLSSKNLPCFHDESDIVLEVDDNDPDETDIYTMVPVNYGSFRFAFPTFYRHFPEPDEGPYINGGRTSVHCIGSADGIHWDRYDRGRYASPEAGEHMVYMGQGIIERGDEIWQYGIGYSTNHGEVERRFRHGDGTMYRFVQRVDGFVSADSELDGSLVTRPIVFDGNRLRLNIDTDGIGIARVGILDETGKQIPGFETKKCDPITTNDTGAAVTWNGAQPDRFDGKTVKLKIESTRTKLYSFWFDTPTSANG